MRLLLRQNCPQDCILNWILSASPPSLKLGEE